MTDLLCLAILAYLLAHVVALTQQYDDIAAMRANIERVHRAVRALDERARERGWR